MSVLIDNRQEKIKVDEAVEAFAAQVVEKVLAYEECEEEFEVSISFVDNEEMRGLNKEYRGIEKETDVLSFPLVEFTEEALEKEGEIALGDIVISMEKALEQSEEYGHSFNRELAFLLVHGMLHLLGYVHDEGASEGEMFDKQEEILERLNLIR